MKIWDTTFFDLTVRNCIFKPLKIDSNWCRGGLIRKSLYLPKAILEFARLLDIPPAVGTMIADFALRGKSDRLNYWKKKEISSVLALPKAIESDLNVIFRLHPSTSWKEKTVYNWTVGKHFRDKLGYIDYCQESRNIDLAVCDSPQGLRNRILHAINIPLELVRVLDLPIAIGAAVIDMALLGKVKPIHLWAQSVIDSITSTPTTIVECAIQAFSLQTEEFIDRVNLPKLFRHKISDFSFTHFLFRQILSLKGGTFVQSSALFKWSWETSMEIEKIGKLPFELIADIAGRVLTIGGAILAIGTLGKVAPAQLLILTNTTKVVDYAYAAFTEFLASLTFPGTPKAFSYADPYFEYQDLYPAEYVEYEDKHLITNMILEKTIDPMKNSIQKRAFRLSHIEDPNLLPLCHILSRVKKYLSEEDWKSIARLDELVMLNGKFERADFHDSDIPSGYQLLDTRILILAASYLGFSDIIDAMGEKVSESIKNFHRYYPKTDSSSCKNIILDLTKKRSFETQLPRHPISKKQFPDKTIPILPKNKDSLRALFEILPKLVNSLGENKAFPFWKEVSDKNDWLSLILSFKDQNFMREMFQLLYSGTDETLESKASFFMDIGHAAALAGNRSMQKAATSFIKERLENIAQAGKGKEMYTAFANELIRDVESSKDTSLLEDEDSSDEASTPQERVDTKKRLAFLTYMKNEFLFSSDIEPPFENEILAEKDPNTVDHDVLSAEDGKALLSNVGRKQSLIEFASKETIESFYIQLKHLNKKDAAKMNRILLPLAQTESIKMTVDEVQALFTR